MTSAKDIPDTVALRACDWIESGVPPWVTLVNMGFPEKVVYAKLRRLINRGHAEFGVSERTAWITGPGRDRLRVLESSGEPPSP